MKGARTNGRFCRVNGKLVPCGCHPCPVGAIQIITEGVVTYGGVITAPTLDPEISNECGRQAVEGTFENGTFVLPKSTPHFYLPRGGGLSYPGKQSDCTFWAIVGDYGPMRLAGYRGTLGGASTCDDLGDEDFFPFVCWRIFTAGVFREGKNEDGQDLYRIQLKLGLIEDGLYPYSIGEFAVSMGMVFEAVFAWDGVSPVTGIPNLIGTGSGETFFVGGTASVSLIPATDVAVIPGDPVDDECTIDVDTAVVGYNYRFVYNCTDDEVASGGVGGVELDPDVPVYCVTPGSTSGEWESESVAGTDGKVYAVFRKVVETTDLCRDGVSDVAPTPPAPPTAEEIAAACGNDCPDLSGTWLDYFDDTPAGGTFVVTADPDDPSVFNWSWTHPSDPDTYFGQFVCNADGTLAYLPGFIVVGAGDWSATEILISPGYKIVKV